MIQDTSHVSSSPLRQILNPDSVAIVGASESLAKFGGRTMHFLVNHGYAGRIIPINPRAATVLGIKAYATVGEAPLPIDVALLAAPTGQIRSAVEQCAAAGVKCCVIITADFAEAGAEGRERQDELVRIARAHGMRLIGPNCLGFVNPHRKLALTSSVALAVEPMPLGTIGLISQSGSLMAGMISHAHDLGTGFSVCVTVGNQADLEICDFIEYMIDDPLTRSICVYVEGLKDGRRFLALADSARAAGKPLLAVKSGRTAAGERVAASHTASLAGSYQVLEAACREHAVCLLDDPEGMIMCAELLMRWGAPRGDGVALMSPSGGTLAVATDRIGGAGLRWAELDVATQSRLTAMVPPGRPLNPLDLGGLAREKSLDASLQALDCFLAAPDVALVAIAVATSPQLDEKVRDWGARALRADKPTVLLLTPGSLVDGARAALRELKCPFTNRMDDAVRIMRAAVDYGAALRMPRTEPCRPAELGGAAGSADALPSGRLTESEAKALLQAAGIATTRERIAASAEQAVMAAQAIGYPVAMKAAVRELVHKSDIGAVKLGLDDADSVQRAWREIAAGLERHLPGARLEACSVQEMARGEIEMIVGARWDTQFGAVVLAGAGGIYVELLGDVQMALAPVTSEGAHALLRRLRIWPLLAGARGRPTLDVAALADAIVRASWLAHELGPRLADLDINPLLVRALGQGVIALDARATLAGPEPTL